MPARERSLDPLLASLEPVHCRQQLGLADLAEFELVGQRRLPEPARRRQLRAGPDQPLDHHRDDEVALAAALAADHPLQVERSQRPQHRGGVAVGQRAFDRKTLVQIDHRLAGEDSANRIDRLSG